MQPKKLFVAISVFCILISSAVSFGAEENTLQAPFAFVPELLHEFAPVLDGVQILNDFIIQNKGTAPLNIEKVKSG